MSDRDVLCRLSGHARAALARRAVELQLDPPRVAASYVEAVLNLDRNSRLAERIEEVARSARRKGEAE